MLGLSWLVLACQPSANGSGEVEQEVSSLDKVVEVYLSLKDAFVASDQEAAQEQAQVLVASLSGVEGTEELAQGAKAIAGTSDLEEQREQFENLSDAIYKVVSKSDAVEKTLYRQYCPMAFDDKGAFWISDSDQVRNPYFGDAMLKCGSVKEVIE